MEITTVFTKHTEKTALVLAGGGSRGAYQIGVWQALKELEIQIDVVTGTSVGALNGALIVQDSFEKAKQIWGNLSSADVMCSEEDENSSNVSGAKIWHKFARDALEHGGADITPLENLIREIIDEETFRSSPVEFALVTVEYPSLKPCEIKKQDVPSGMLPEYLLASAACFPAFKTKEINGTQYIDGGYHDNLPINLALELGAVNIIAVDLESIGRIRPVKHEYKKITYIRSTWPLGTFLVFEKELSARNMKLGYLDTFKVFGKYFGYSYAFNRETCMNCTKNLHASIVELSGAIKTKDSSFAKSLERILMRHLFHDFCMKTNERLPFTITQQFILSAEYAGECFKIDPTCVYEFADFNALLMDNFRELSKTSWSMPSTLRDIPHVVDELKKLDKKYLVYFFVLRLREFLSGGKGTEILFLARAFWKEFAAALYLCCLGNLLPNTPSL